MITDLIRLSALYVLVRVFVEIALPSSKHIVKYLFWAGVALTIVGTVGPYLTRVADDVHDLSIAYTETKNGVEKAVGVVDAVTSWTEEKENIPFAGVGASKYPPGISLYEKLRPSTIRFNYPLSGTITQEFKGTEHHGIDIDCKEGTIVKASREGKVAVVGLHEVYGNYVLVEHGTGWQTLYAHLSKVAVKKGDRLWGNSIQVGLSGGTKGTQGAGNSKGPHLHMEIRVGGKAIDPRPLMKE